MTTTLSRTPSTDSRPRKSSRAARVRRGKLVRRIVLGALALGIALAIVLAFRPRPLEVDIVAAVRGDLRVTVDEMGKTRVRDRYVVAAPVGGNMLRIELEAGDTVEAGTLLARIVPMTPAFLDARSRSETQARVGAAAAAERQAKTAVARASIAKEHASNEAMRVRRLVETGALPKEALLDAELEERLRTEEVASARFAEQMAKSQLSMAQAALGRFDKSTTPSETFDVPSPVPGRVLRLVTESAGPVQVGAPLLEVGDPDALEIVADVLSADAVRIHPRAPVVVERWGGAPLAAHVRRVDPSGFTRLSALGVEEQRVAVVIDLDAPREQWDPLGDGFRVEVRITVEEKTGVVHVPLASVFRHGEGWALYVLREERTRLVPVKLGIRSDRDVEIESGLAADELVLVHPSERVADGARVRAR